VCDWGGGEGGGKLPQRLGLVWGPPEADACHSFLFALPRGVGPGCNTREIAHKLIELKADIEDLEQREQELEQQKMWVQQSIKNVTEDVQNSRYPLPVTPSPCLLTGLESGELRAGLVLPSAGQRGGGDLLLLEELR